MVVSLGVSGLPQAARAGSLCSSNRSVTEWTQCKWDSEVFEAGQRCWELVISGSACGLDRSWQLRKFHTDDISPSLDGHRLEQNVHLRKENVEWLQSLTPGPVWGLPGPQRKQGFLVAHLGPQPTWVMGGPGGRQLGVEEPGGGHQGCGPPGSGLWVLGWKPGLHRW